MQRKGARLNWTIEYSEDAMRDLELIFQHLSDSYIDLGDAVSEAVDRAAVRIDRILGQAERIGAVPHGGESHDDLLSGLRHLTLDQAIYWFEIDAERGVVRILAIFNGGQDYQRRMLVRLLSQN